MERQMDVKYLNDFKKVYSNYIGYRDEAEEGREGKEHG